MKKWKVTYRDEDGDITNVWCTAPSKSDAIEYVKDEYWDIEDIIDCVPLK
mgnify:CR=1 FL=1